MIILVKRIRLIKCEILQRLEQLLRTQKILLGLSVDSGDGDVILNI